MSGRSGPGRWRAVPGVTTASRRPARPPARTGLGRHTAAAVSARPCADTVRRPRPVVASRHPQLRAPVAALRMDDAAGSLRGPGRRVVPDPRRRSGRRRATDARTASASSAATATTPVTSDDAHAPAARTRADRRPRRLLWVTLPLRLRDQIADAPPGTVVHAVATDPRGTARPAHLVPHDRSHLSRPVPGERPVYAPKLTADARATRPDAPWHPLRRRQEQPRNR